MTREIKLKNSREFNRLLRNTGATPPAKADSAILGEIMTAASDIAIHALTLAGVPGREIDRIFLRDPAFSAYRLARCQESAKSIVKARKP
jgi:hypothetical protein